jgi:hypothetical protein
MGNLGILSAFVAKVLSCTPKVSHEGSTTEHVVKGAWAFFPLGAPEAVKLHDMSM